MTLYIAYLTDAHGEQVTKAYLAGTESEALQRAVDERAAFYAASGTFGDKPSPVRDRAISDYLQGQLRLSELQTTALEVTE